MWVLVGAVFAALGIFTVNNGKQQDDNEKEHQRRNCFEREKGK